MSKSRASGAPQKAGAGASGGIVTPNQVSIVPVDEFFSNLANETVKAYQRDLKWYLQGPGNVSPLRAHMFYQDYNHVNKFLAKDRKSLDMGKLTTALQNAINSEYTNILTRLNATVGRITSAKNLKFDAKTGSVSGTVTGSNGTARVSITPRKNVRSNGLLSFLTRIR